MRSFISRLSLVAFALVLASCATTSGTKKTKMSTAEQSDLMIRTAAGTIEENDPIGALQLLAEAEKLTPNRPEIFHLRTIAYTAKGEPTEALAAARKAVALAPEVAEYNNNLGKLLLDHGKLNEAETLLLKSANDQLYRDAYKANTSLGILYYRRGQEAEARKRFAKAAQQSPRDACVAYYYLGHIDLKASRFDEAIRHYDRATRQLCASFSDAHYALGLAYEQAQQFEKARRKFMDITSAFPDSQVATRAMNRLRNLP